MEKKAVKILGLDPGSRHTGYGLVEHRGRKLQALAMGRISLPTKMPLADRLGRLATELRQLVDHHEPDVAVLESLFHGVNPRSLIVLAQARGALLTTVNLCGLKACEYSPAEIKMALTGSGRADKTQVARMVRLILALKDDNLPADATDALAVSICFAQHLPYDRLTGRAKVARTLI
jgi:crossover junction endodeoxyribonuclease RuvC